MTTHQPVTSISCLTQRVDGHRLKPTREDESEADRDTILRSAWKAMGTMTAYDHGADGRGSTNQLVKANSELAAAAAKTSEALGRLRDAMGTDDMAQCGEVFWAASGVQRADMLRRCWELCLSTLNWNIAAEERKTVWGGADSGVSADEGWTDDFYTGSE